jgi:hypothetical protein
MSSKKATKAALYSALVFPGAGLLWLKHYKRACIFIIPTLVALWFLISRLYNAIMPVYSKMLRDAQEGVLIVDANTITGIYTKLYQEIQHTIDAMQNQLHAAQAILVAAWICSIASSYFLGKKLDTEERKKESTAQDK